MPIYARLITTTFINFILMIPIVLVFVYFEIGENEIGGINFEEYSLFGLFFLTVIFAPIIETIIGQLLPIKLIGKIFRKKFKLIPVLISAIFFSLMHFEYSVWYGILTFPKGFLLAHTYVVFQERKESSF